jgi:hypothetical protein
MPEWTRTLWRSGPMSVDLTTDIGFVNRAR